MTDPNGLLYMRARYYNPYICRFINPDPSGFGGGLNWSCYADGNPISMIDPFGLCAGDGEAGGNYWTGVGQVFAGYGDAASGMAKGLGNAIINADDTFETLGNAVANPGQTGQAIWNGVGSTFNNLGSTDSRVQGQAMGNILITAASIAAPYARAGQVAGASGGRRGRIQSRPFPLRQQDGFEPSAANTGRPMDPLMGVVCITGFFHKAPVLGPPRNSECGIQPYGVTSNHRYSIWWPESVNQGMSRSQLAPVVDWGIRIGVQHQLEGPRTGGAQLGNSILGN